MPPPLGPVNPPTVLRPEPAVGRQPRMKPRAKPSRTTGVAVLIPAYNEEASIRDTIASVKAQSVLPDEIIVVDDCSSDRTGEFAAEAGARVVRTPKNTGNKSSALNYGLTMIESEFTLAIDADTVLAEDAIELLLPAMEDEKVAGACGYVIPRRVQTIWERGRYVEYLFAFSLYKPLQDYYDKPLLASGCFSLYRTKVLRELDGWPCRTLAEDMDLTWNCYLAGYKVRFVEDAVCYPIEPHNLKFLSRQLRRWSAGFVQCVRVHWKDVVHIPFLRNVVAIGMWDATLCALAFLALLPLLAIFVSPIFLLGYFIDMPAVLVPVMRKAIQRGEVGRALASLPGFFVIRFVNSYYVLRAIWTELICRKQSVRVFQKGH
ncbi:MAG TPA: glycosyltransferase family 2 protein [Phycisphaerales bacterium]|nr:glycosyltransferase family 2 protein [Phycisphaerales bacterium]